MVSLSLDSPGMNVSAIDHLISAYSGVSSANKTKLQKLKVILARFHEQGIESMLLKGADLIPRLYGVFGVRAMVDVDLLVHQQDLPAIDKIVKELGYRPQIDGNPVYADPDYTMVLDLVTDVWYLDDPAVIWQRAVPRELEGMPVRAMGTNDLLIFLTAYAVVHRGCLSGSFVQDITLLVQKEKVDWDLIEAEACRRHLKIPVYHGLSYIASRFDQNPIPDQVLKRLAPSDTPEKIVAALLQKLVTDKAVPELGHLLLFLTQPGIKRWRWLRKSFSPSEPFLFYRYGDRCNSHPFLTRLARPFSLLFQAVRLFTRIVRRQITGRV